MVVDCVVLAKHSHVDLDAIPLPRSIPGQVDSLHEKPHVPTSFGKVFGGSLAEEARSGPWVAVWTSMSSLHVNREPVDCLPDLQASPWILRCGNWKDVGLNSEGHLHAEC